MDKVALLPADDRAALFGETGAGRGVANTIIEKDFWVCWSLRRLFGLPKGTTASLVFKGGTSLSKAFGANRAQMSALVGQSQGATGALQATQAGNQLLALQAQQLADLTAVVAANGRAQALQSAEQAAAAEQGREQRRRFLTPGTGYQPGNARMFPGSN